MANIDLTTPVRGDCGHDFEVSFTRKDLDLADAASFAFTCPICGGADSFDPDQCQQLITQFDAAVRAAPEQVGKELNKILTRSLTGLKHVKYRPE